MEEWFKKSDEEIENFLLKRWELNELILNGEYVKSTNSHDGYFVNIRSWDYEATSFPIIEGVNIKSPAIFIFYQSNLKEGLRYEFKAILESENRRVRENNPFLLRADHKTYPIKLYSPNPKEFVLKLFQNSNNTPRSIKNKLRKAYETIQTEINKRPETFIYELLQNADDYPVENEKVRVQFEITNDSLLLNHNGSPFKVNNIHAICGVNEKDKSDSFNKIGFKGIGFKSVFNDCDYVFINSGRYQFRFEKAYHEDETFWQTIPIWTEKNEVQIAEQHSFWRDSVGIILKPRSKNTISNPENGYRQVLNSIFRDSRILLFLRNVKKVIVRSGTKVFVCKVEDSDWYLGNYDFQVPDIEREWLNNKILLESEKDKSIPEKYLNLEKSRISFVAAREQNQIKQIKSATLFVYLPTRVDLKFPFLINGDFIPDGDRDELRDLHWNYFLMEQAGREFITWLSEIGKSNEPYYDRDYLNHLLPDFDACINSTDNKFHKLIKFFRKGFLESFIIYEFIPDAKQNLKKPKSILIDHTDLSTLLEDEFYEITGIQQTLIHDSLSKNRVLEKLIGEHGRVFDKSDLEDLIDSEKLDQWLTDPENNARFLQLLEKKGWLNSFKSKSIFLNQNNSLCSAEEIYDSFGDDWELLNWLELSYLNSEVSKLTSGLYLPIKEYEVQKFVKDEILENNSEVDDLLDVKSNNLAFFRYLFKYQLKLAELLNVSSMSYFKAWDVNEKIIGRLNDNSYQFNAKLKELTDAGAFPEDWFQILSPDYCEADEAKPRWEEFWHRLGVERYEVSTVAKFLNNEVISQLAKLEKHFDDYECPDDGGEPTDSLLQKQNANLVLWQFIDEAIKQLPPEPNKEIRRGLGRLVVFTTEPCTTRLLQECFLSRAYTGNSTLEEVASKFPGEEIYFVSDYYLKYLGGTKWTELFKKCGAKDNEQEFVERLMADIDRFVTEGNLVSTTQYLFKHEKLLDENDERLSSLRILTSDGFVKANDAVIGAYYTQDSLLDDILPSVELTNLISEEYADKDLSKWVAFFRKLGVITLDTEEKVIEYKVRHLLENQDEIHTAENSLVIISELVTLHKEGNLSELIDPLGELYLLLKKNEIEFTEANRCHLATEYEPNLNLETLLSGDEKSELDFVSEKYLSGRESKSNVSKFFRKIGVANDFKVIESFSENRKDLSSAYRNAIDEKNSNIKANAQNYSINHKIEPWFYLNYADLLGNFLVASRFWEKILKDDASFRKELLKDATYKFSNSSVKVFSYIAFRLQTESVIPTISGYCAKAAELYSVNFKDIIEDKSLLPAIDLSKCEVENQSLEAWLGIKQELSLALCLDYIRRKQDFDFLERKGIWRRIKAIIDLNGAERLDSEAKAALITFKENGLLPNQLNEWKPIEKLYFIENFEIGIGNSPWLVNKEIEFLAEAMGLKKLVESDFNPDFIGKNTESNLTSTLRDRMKYIAFAENQNDWVEREKGYSNRLGAYQFYRTSKIAFSYSEVVPPIQKTDLKFHRQENNVYFVGEWRGARAAELFDFVHKAIGLEKVTSGLLMDLLLNTESEILESFKDKQMPVPVEWELPNSTLLNQF